MMRSLPNLTCNMSAKLNHRDQLLNLRQETLDDLLSRWDHWLHPVRVGRGHNSSAAGCGLYRVSRQYDDENGALDDQIEHRVMLGVQACVERLLAREQAAIHVDARNQRLGQSEWRAPLLPATEPESRAAIAAARVRLIQLLTGAGLMD